MWGVGFGSLFAHLPTHIPHSGISAATNPCYGPWRGAKRAAAIIKAELKHPCLLKRGGWNAERSAAGCPACAAVRCDAVWAAWRWPGRQPHEMALSHSLPRHGPKPERATLAINYTARRLSSPCLALEGDSERSAAIPSRSGRSGLGPPSPCKCF